MEYIHHFRVKAPLSRVAAFHRQSLSMGAITPPPIRVKLGRAPVTLSSASEMDFTLWLGPLAIGWEALIEDVSESGFTDRQLSGPFSEWVHRHTFVQEDDQTTEVIDRVSLRLKPHPWWGPVGLGFLLGLPVLFAYRARATRRLLEKGSD
jgi:ligand-binding SRPBCC domain-containing protein